MITGVGTIGAFGAGRESLAATLRSGSVPTVEVDRTAGYHLPGSARRVAAVPSLDLSRWIAPAAARRMGPPSKSAVAAARMALAEAGFGERVAAPGVTAIFLSTAFGAVAFTERLVRQILLESPEAAQPFLFSECVANAAAGQLAIAVGARGANTTLTQREAGPLLALGRAAAEVREGRAVRALAGSVDEMTPLLHAILDRYGALARPGPEGEEIARPFDRRRGGVLAGEGATVLLLERASDAAARGATILARVAAAGSAFDPSATTSDWGDGHDALATALLTVLSRAGLSTRNVGAIVSGASGSIRGDRLEALVLRSAWRGEPLPPVLAPKGTTGEYGGGILAPGVLAATEGAPGPTLGFREKDEELDVIPHDGRAPGPWSSVLLTGLAAGGAAAWAVLERA